MFMVKFSQSKIIAFAILIFFSSSLIPSSDIKVMVPELKSISRWFSSFILPSDAFAASITATNSVLVAPPYNQETSTGCGSDTFPFPCPDYVIFGTYTVTFNFYGGTVYLSSSPAAFQQFKVDNGLIITVTRPDSSTVSYNSVAQGWVDNVTSLFQYGSNTVTVEFVDNIQGFTSQNVGTQLRGSCGNWDINFPGTYGQMCNSLYLFETYAASGQTSDMTTANGCNSLSGYPVCLDSGCKTITGSTNHTVCKDCWEWDKRYACSGSNYQAGDTSCLQGVLDNSKSVMATAYTGCVTETYCSDLRPAATYTNDQSVNCQISSPVALANKCYIDTSVWFDVSQVECHKILNIAADVNPLTISLVSAPGYSGSGDGFQKTPWFTSNINYTQGIVTLKNPDGGNICADDYFVFGVTKPDGSYSEWSYSNPGGLCSGLPITCISAYDITPYLGVGNNTISIQGADACGGTVGITPVSIYQQENVTITTESWDDQCLTYASDTYGYTSVSGPTCIDGPSTKLIGTVLLNRNCWNYKSIYDKYTQNQSLNTSLCDTYSSNRNCYLVSETCLDNTPRTIQGRTVSGICWQSEKTYDCAYVENASNGCSTYESDPNCSLVSSTCVATLQSGDCQSWDKRYTCTTTTTVAEECLQTAERKNCAGEMYCQDSTNCVDTTPKANKDFGRAASMLAFLEQVKELGPLNIFKGVGKQCMSGDIMGKNCCKEGSLAVQAILATYVASSAITSVGSSGVLYAGGVQASSYSIVGIKAFLSSLSSGGFAGISNFAAYAMYFAYIVVIIVALVVAYMVYQSLTTCDENQRNSAIAIELGHCSYIGEYCDNVGPFGICYSHQKTYCCFESLLTQIIWWQGGNQINKSRGTAQNPDCSGFTVEELMQIDFSLLDFSPFYSAITVKSPDMTDKTNAMTLRIQNSITSQTQPPAP